MKINKKWFTLIEIVISLTIFSIMMISMITIYILNSETSAKSDINRALHENIKSVFVEISEDVIKNWITWVSNSTIDGCNFDLTYNYKKWTKLCSSWLNNYYLAKKDTWWNYVRVENVDCSNLTDQCFIVKNGSPLTNSLVSIKNLSFYASSFNINKVTMLIELQPTVNVWIKSNRIEENNMIFQTTISERLF